jgi:YD repeat-containing protein
VPASAITGPVVITESGVSSNAVTFIVGTGGFHGTVTQVRDGARVAGALVELLQANVVKASAFTSPDGSYATTSVNPGTYDLRFSSSGLGTMLSPGNTVNAGGTVLVNAALQDPGGIAGRVSNAGGAGIAGASIAILSGSVVVATATTDTTGRYTSSLLGSGTYAVTAAASGFNAQTNNGIAVTAGINATSDFNLAGQSVVTYTYDDLGRIRTVSDSLAGTATYNYDAVGNLLSITNP